MHAAGTVCTSATAFRGVWRTSHTSAAVSACLEKSMAGADHTVYGVVLLGNPLSQARTAPSLTPCARFGLGPARTEVGLRKACACFTRHCTSHNPDNRCASSILPTSCCVGRRVRVASPRSSSQKKKHAKKKNELRARRRAERPDREPGESRDTVKVVLGLDVPCCHYHEFCRCMKRPTGTNGQTRRLDAPCM